MWWFKQNLKTITNSRGGKELSLAVPVIFVTVTYLMFPFVVNLIPRLDIIALMSTTFARVKAWVLTAITLTPTSGIGFSKCRMKTFD